MDTNIDVNSLLKTVNGLKSALSGIKEFEKEVNENLPKIEESDKQKADEIKRLLSKLDIQSADNVLLDFDKINA
jgi:hypothetical protein